MTTQETIFEEVDSVEVFDTMDDLAPKFIKSPKVGEKVDMIVKGFNKVSDKSELDFTYEEDGKQKTASSALSKVDFGIKITTIANETFWVNSWSVFGQIKAIANKLNSTNWANLQLQIDHVANGMIKENRYTAWTVRTMIEGQWKALDRETNDWV